MNTSKRTMIIGAGQACKILLNEIFNAQKSAYVDDKYSAQFEPVCLICNDRKKLGTKLMGVEIVGTDNDIPRIAKEYNIDQIIFAIPSLTEDERKEVIDIFNETKLPLKIVPFIRV